MGRRKSAGIPYTPPRPKCTVCGQPVDRTVECEACAKATATLTPEVADWIKNVVETAITAHEEGRIHNPMPEGW